MLDPSPRDRPRCGANVFFAARNVFYHVNAVVNCHSQSTFCDAFSRLRVHLDSMFASWASEARRRLRHDRSENDNRDKA